MAAGYHYDLQKAEYPAGNRKADPLPAGQRRDHKTFDGIPAGGDPAQPVLSAGRGRYLVVRRGKGTDRAPKGQNGDPEKMAGGRGGDRGQLQQRRPVLPCQPAGRGQGGTAARPIYQKKVRLYAGYGRVETGQGHQVQRISQAGASGVHPYFPGASVSNPGGNLPRIQLADQE